MKVFINCAAGVSRSSTVFLAFVALFGLYNYDEQVADDLFSPDSILNKDQKSLVQDLCQYLLHYHTIGVPNLRVVHAVIDGNKRLVEEHRRRLLEEEARRRKAQEERDRDDALKKQEAEAALARLKKLAEDELERLRLQRLQHAEDEKKRREQDDADEMERQRRMKMLEEDFNARW